jgi:predicted nucleic acid-binding protein
VIVLDASVLIAHFDGTDPHHEAATALLLEAIEEGFAASPLTLAEVLVGPARAGRLAEAEAVLRELDVAAVPLPEDAPPRLAQLRADIGLRLPDCCVLLAAQDSSGVVATFDDRQATRARELGLSVRTTAEPDELG